jgi:GntR family transcriptional regulator
MSEHLSVNDLPITPIDEDSSVPLYRQIEEDLRRLITTGVLPPGGGLPPEVELSRAYGVGRQTIRLALSRLVSSDLIARYAGRGTFVKPQTDRLKFYLDRSFTRQMAEMGLQTRSRVLEMSSGVIDESSPAELADHLGEPCLRLVRLRLGDDQPIGIQSSTILSAQCSGIEGFDFNQQSLYDVLATHYRLPIAEINHTVGATIVDALQAALLQVASGAPLLLVNTTAWLENGDVIEHTTSFYRADKYEFSTSHRYSI